jgi:hypothetical protein
VCAFTSLILGLGHDHGLHISLSPSRWRWRWKTWPQPHGCTCSSLLGHALLDHAAGRDRLLAAAGIACSPAAKTGWESMWVGSIIYFIPFFS